MINLKKLLTKILAQLKLLENTKSDARIATFSWTSAGINLTDYHVWHSINDFTITPSFKTSDSSIFQLDNEGIKVLKPGWYWVKAHVEMISTSGTTGTSMAIRLYNYVAGTVSSPTRYFITQCGWSYMSSTCNCFCNANEIITVQVYKNNPDKVSITYKPNSGFISVIYLGDAE